MVARKTSLPYVNDPGSHPTFANHDPSHEGSLVPDSTELPPIPRPARRSPGLGNDPAFDHTVNPWSDVSQGNLRSDRPLPDILRPGSHTPEHGNNVSLSNIPNVLRAGHPGEDTPRSSLESKRSKDFWEDSDDAEEVGTKSPKKASGRSPQRHIHSDLEVKKDDSLVPNDAALKSPGIKRKPVAVSPKTSGMELTADAGFASNNPFRRPSQTGPPGDGAALVDWAQDASAASKGKAPVRDVVDQSPPTQDFQSLHLGNSPTRTPGSRNAYQQTQVDHDPWQGHPSSVPPMPMSSPPPPPAEPLSPFSKQPPLIPIDPLPNDSLENPWSTSARLGDRHPSPIPFSPSQKQVSKYNDDLLDRGHNQQTGVVSLKDELSTLPNAADTTPVATFPHPEASLLEDEDEAGPPLPVRPVQRTGTDYFDPPEGPPPPKPPRPTIQTTAPSEQEIAKVLEQRNETYQVKHFNWFDHSSRRLRASSMLTQNKNGPCPLLALVNALILGAKDESQAALDEALRAREQVTLGLIIETLMDELLTRGLENVGTTLPDVDELNAFLLRLRTGMNANPRFVPPNVPAPNLMDDDDSLLNVPQQQRNQQTLGTFEATTDMRLYGAFNIPLVHGWLPKPGSDADKAFARSAQTYEDAQALQFGEEELEYKLSNSSLTPDEESMWRDITSIKNFFTAYPTQLTTTGLEAVRDSIPSGSFAIMFRNDHFSTIYKHPESGQLFTLITDAGYVDRDEIIWESLVDITGKHNEFFSGDFMPVSHNESVDESNTHPTARRSSQRLSVNNPTVAPLSPQEQQEQHDADFAMALQLQEEEEQRQRAERNRRRGGAIQSSSGNRRSTGNIPIPLSGRPQTQAEVRPSIPPRTSRNTNPAVNRPSDADVDDAPPAYEEAAKGRPYLPPMGSPLHPHSGPSPMNSNPQLTGTISNTSGTSALDSHPPGPNMAMGRRQPGRRMSAYNEQNQYYQSPQRTHGMNVAQGAAGAGPSRPGNKQDRDCVVM